VKKFTTVGLFKYFSCDIASKHY